MQQEIISALINNAALLIILSLIYELTYYIFPRSLIKQIITGGLIALTCIAIMSMPFTFMPGVVFDTRSILISVTALIFGPITTIITVIPAIIFRLFQGGMGAIPGIAVISTSAIIGSVWRRWTTIKKIQVRWYNIYIMGLIVHITMIACMLLMPYPDNINVIREITLPVLIIYPIATVLLCLLLTKQQTFWQLRDEIKQSEEQFRLLYHNAPLAYQSLDIDGKIVDVNQKWLDTFGYLRKEVIGSYFYNFLKPEHIEEYLKSFDLFKQVGQVHNEFEIIHKNGISIYISFDGNIGYDSNGQFKQAYCILRDITEGKKAEIEVRQSELKFRRLFATMSQGVVSQAADGRILSANPEAEKILGLSLDQMKGKTSEDSAWKTIYEDGSEMPGSKHPSMIALRTGKPCGPVVLGVFQPKLNSHIWLSVNATPIIEQDGTLSQVYTIFQDITAEKKAKQDYQLLFNSMVDGFALHEIICDNDGKPIDYRFLAVNPAFERIVGKKAKDIIGKTVLEVLPNTESYWIETYGKVALTGESVMFENYAASTDKHFRVTAYQPAPMQFACTFSDDTSRVKAEKELFRTLARLRGLLNNSYSPIIIFNDKGKIVEISVAAENIIGLSREEMIGKNMNYLGLSNTLNNALLLFDSPVTAGQIIENTDVFELDGEQKYFESRLFMIDTNQPGEKLFGYLGIDVTARIMAEQALKESEKKYSSYIENAPYAVIVVDEKGNYLDCNKAASTITGYSKKQILSMNLRDITAPESIDEAINHFKTLMETGKMSAELRYCHRDGSIRWWTVDAVKISKNRHLGFSIDITDRKQAEAELINLNQRDHLTGIYNRRFYEAELKRMNDIEHLPLSVIIGDIDGVKFINDAFGHAVGDKLIVETAMILKECCRQGDILARTGGDEFSILMPNTDNTTASEVLHKIQNAIKEFDANSNVDIYQLSVSLGCATKVLIDEDIQDTIKIAEGHMYQRKLLEQSSAHSAIVSSIKATLFEKSHETEEHAQRLIALSKEVGIALNLSQAELDKLELLASLHDIGKVGVRDDILTKPDKLNEKEWIEIKRHPEIGYRIAMSSPELAPIAEGILCHHEWWNGKGYPQGLCGESIPLISRIVSVVDAYDAMTNDRPYRKALDQELAIEIIKQNAGSQFDPQIVKFFINILS
ncbi:MAG: PAS domain S-box protein [Clostridiales bacterium]|nr:PAS domain S-box protein [Clostridiales bacterium]